MSNNKTSLLKNIVWIAFSNIFGKFLTFISSIVVARILFPEDFGIISMAATFSGLIDYSSKLGINAYIISRTNINEKVINSAFVLNILVSLVFSLIMIVGAPFVANFYKTPEINNILFFSGISFFLACLPLIPIALLTREMKQSIISKVEIIRSFVNVSLIITFALLGFRYLSFVIPLLIANLVACIIYYFIINRKFTFRMEKETVLESLNYGKYFMPKTMLMYVLYNSDYIFIGYLLGSKLLGYYYFGFEKALMIVLIGCNVIIQIFSPVFSKYQIEKDNLKQSVISVIQKSTFLMYPLIFLQIFLAKELITVFYGSRWDNSILTFQLILGYSFFRILAVIMHVLFDSTGKPEQNLKHFLIVTPICMIGIFVGTKIGSLFGASIAAFFVQSLAVVLLIDRVIKKFNWSFKEVFLPSLKPFIPILVQFPFLIAIKSVLNSINTPYLAILMIIPLAFIFMYVLLTKIFLKNIYESIIVNISNKILAKIRINKEIEKVKL